MNLRHVQKNTQNNKNCKPVGLTIQYTTTTTITQIADRKRTILTDTLVAHIQSLTKISKYMELPLHLQPSKHPQTHEIMLRPTNSELSVRVTPVWSDKEEDRREHYNGLEVLLPKILTIYNNNYNNNNKIVYMYL